MKRYSGQSLSEYGLVIGLVALAALAGLVLLSGNIRTALANMNTPAGGGGSAQLSSLPPGSTPPAAPGGSAPTGPQMRTSYDPRTGMVSLTLDDGGSGSVTTGSRGTEAAALALARLAESAALSDDPNMEDALRRLARLGQQLASQQASLTGPPSQDIDSAAYRAYYNSGIIDTNKDFWRAYQVVNNLIESNPRYRSNLRTQINDYSGVISSITSYNYAAQYQRNQVLADGRIVPLTLADIRRDYIVGTDISRSNLTMPLTPPTWAPPT